MNYPLGTKLELRFEKGGYFGPFTIDAICHHVEENRFTYSLVKCGEEQPSFWFDSGEIINFSHHPEQRADQIYMGNGCLPDLRFNPSDWGFRNMKDMGWKSKTFGKVAYDIYGKPIKGMAPIFIDKSEVQSAIQRKKDEIEILGDKAYGAKETIQVWQSMLDAGTVFDY